MSTLTQLTHTAAAPTPAEILAARKARGALIPPKAALRRVNLPGRDPHGARHTLYYDAAGQIRRSTIAKADGAVEEWEHYTVEEIFGVPACRQRGRR